MKQVIGFAMALLILNGCAKDQQSSAKRVGKSIEGRWELRQTSAAMVPGTQEYSPGNGHELTFHDRQYERYSQGSLLQSGTYEIVADGSVAENVCLEIAGGRYEQRIVYDGNVSGEKLFMHLDGDRLFFIAGCYALDGGHQMIYQRKK